MPQALSRILYAVPMGVFGLFHFMNGPQMVDMVPKFIPGGIFWVYLVGVALILATVAIIMNKKARTASYLLGIMLSIFIFTIYIPMVMNGVENAMGMLLKEIALAGAAFFIGNHLSD
ncbi:DoxX family protein [bacterium]|nr:DoxX family protein [bacterium]